MARHVYGVDLEPVGGRAVVRQSDGGHPGNDRRSYSLALAGRVESIHFTSSPKVVPPDLRFHGGGVVVHPLDGVRRRVRHPALKRHDPLVPEAQDEAKGRISQDGTTGPDSLGVGYATDREDL